jgi:putative membrane protein
MRTKLFTLMGVAVLSLAACSRHDSDVAAADNSSDATANAANEVAAAPSAQEFVANASASDLFEIESGKLAAEKASSPKLKDLANMLVSDHQKSTADLKAAAAKPNPPIQVAPALDPEKQAMLDMLKSADAANFDRTYVGQQKQAHQKAVDLLGQYQSTGDNQALKDFANKVKPVVQGHLDKLNGLQP